MSPKKKSIIKHLLDNKYITVTDDEKGTYTCSFCDSVLKGSSSSIVYHLAKSTQCSSTLRAADCVPIAEGTSFLSLE